MGTEYVVHEGRVEKVVDCRTHFRIIASADFAEALAGRGLIKPDQIHVGEILVEKTPVTERVRDGFRLSVVETKNKGATRLSEIDFVDERGQKAGSASIWRGPKAAH